MNEIPQSNLPSVAPPIAGQTAPSANQLMRFENEKKSAGVGLFLCWVMGAFGAHRFYLKQPNAIAMLVITLVSIPLCLVFIGFLGMITVWIWMIVDLFAISRWTREYNNTLFSKIASDPTL